jgi:ribosome biogenesis GTPase
LYYVLIDGHEVECRQRGRFRLEKRPVLTGDQVQVSLIGDGKGAIEEILPRKSELKRPPIANVDQALVVFTLKAPEKNLPILDRFLVLAENTGLDVIIVLNKTDLLAEEEVNDFAQTYRTIGYPVLPVSAREGTGLDALRPLLGGKTSVVAGQSGVGKSRLLNSLKPGLQLVTGGLTAKLERGRHTTRHVELIPLESGGLVADSPGFTYLEFAEIEKEELRDLFPEFRPFTPQCRFSSSCLHRHEPDCRVKEALTRGPIAQSRYDNYLAFLAEIEAQRKY